MALRVQNLTLDSNDEDDKSLQSAHPHSRTKKTNLTEGPEPDQRRNCSEIPYWLQRAA